MLTLGETTCVDFIDNMEVRKKKGLSCSNIFTDQIWFKFCHVFLFMTVFLEINVHIALVAAAALVP